MVRNNLNSRDQIEFLINDRCNTSTDTTKIPIWNGGRTDVDGKIITIPLDCLILRINNTRTKDLQKGAIQRNRDGKNLFHPITGEEIDSPNEDTFKEENQWTLETQNFQSTLLLNEANKQRTGKSLIEIIQTKHWDNTDRPIITKQGVLINGNTRIAALEYLLSINTETGIDSTNPTVEVIVVPDQTPTYDDIKALEQHLQSRITDVLYYNWIQITTEIMDMPVFDISRRETIESILPRFQHHAGFQTVDEIITRVRERMLADELLSLIDLKDQTFEVDPAEHLIREMLVKMDFLGDSVDPVNRASYVEKLKSTFAAFLLVSINKIAKGEMRYHVQRMQKTEDCDTMHDGITEIIPNLIIEGETDDKGFTEISTFLVDTEKWENAEQEEKENLAEKISELANEMKERNSGGNKKKWVISRVKDSFKNLSNAVRYYDDCKDDPSVDFEDYDTLKTHMDELGRKWSFFRKKIDGDQ